MVTAAVGPGRFAQIAVAQSAGGERLLLAFICLSAATAWAAMDFSAPDYIRVGVGVGVGVVIMRGAVGLGDGVAVGVGVGLAMILVGETGVAVGVGVGVGTNSGVGEAEGVGVGDWLCAKASGSRGLAPPMAASSRQAVTSAKMI